MRRHLSNTRGLKNDTIGTKHDTQFAAEAQALRGELKAYTEAGGDLGNIVIVDRGHEHFLLVGETADEGGAGEQVP